MISLRGTFCHERGLLAPQIQIATAILTVKLTSTLNAWPTMFLPLQRLLGTLRLPHLPSRSMTTLCRALGMRLY